MEQVASTVATETVKQGLFASVKETVAAFAKENPNVAMGAAVIGGVVVVGAVGYGLYRWWSSDSAEPAKAGIKDVKEAAAEKVAEAADTVKEKAEATAA